MTSDTTLFPITVVSTDTTAMQELSWTLSSFGYQVVASSDWSEHAHWQQTERPSLLLLDARDEEEIQAVLSSRRSAPFVYRIAFHDAIATASSEQLMDLGADDLINYPFNTGELLTRLRSGLRRLEFERRFAMTKTLDLRTGIATKRGFIRQLERQLSDGSDNQDGALAVLGIDFLDQVYSQHGYFAVEEATTTLAQCLSNHIASEDYCGMLQEGVFAVLLQGYTVNEGVQFAEIVANEVNEQDTSLRDSRTRLSVSGVVLNWPSGASAKVVVERGLTDLKYVKSSGGNLILDANEVEQDFSNWQEQFDASTPLRAVFAQHVMEALPLILPINGLASKDKHSLGIYAFASGQSLPPCIPIVDESGFLLGVIEPSSLRQQGSDVLQTLDESLMPVSDTVHGNLPLDELISTMAMVEEDYLVVVENKKPIGYITSENLAILTADPIEEQVEPQQAEVGLDSLVVSLG